MLPVLNNNLVEVLVLCFNCVDMYFLDDPGDKAKVQRVREEWHRSVFVKEAHEKMLVAVM